MDSRRLYPLLILPALLLAACAPDMEELLSEDENRARAIEALVGDSSRRDEVFERLLGRPSERTALFATIVEDEELAGALVARMIHSDHGKAVVASRIASDSETTRTFIGMLMLTGAAGEILSQRQAECLELGDALAHGNQRRTMEALKRLGAVVDDWARRNGGSYPVCDRLENVTGCLASSLPSGALADLRLTDAWGRPLLYSSNDRGTTYALISYATDGKYDELGKAGPTSSYNADIVFADGDFVQWPGHIPRDDIR